MASIRTVSGIDWDRASMEEPIKEGEISSAVDRCMLELLQNSLSRGTDQDITPWAAAGENVLGAMWAGVPGVGGTYENVGGAWMIPFGAGGSSLISTHPHYIRLSPAPPRCGGAVWILYT